MPKLFSKKKEENSIMNIALIIFVVIAIIYGIVLILKNSFQKPIVYNSSNIQQYISDENLVKSDYFYNLDTQVANFLEAVDKEMYFELYQILISNYNKIYSKNELTKILKKYKEEIFIYDANDLKLDYTGHVINVYNIDKNRYLVQLDFNDGNFYMILGMGRNKYNFTIVE